MSQNVAIGIDVGGTFTDLAAISADGQVTAAKVLSTPSDRALGVVSVLGQGNVVASDVAFIAHGTTVVTNLLLERTGARVTLCATAGFTDLLELRRQDRAALYDLAKQHAPPLVHRSDVVGVMERIGHDCVLVALSAEVIAETVEKVRELRPETVAIAFLHSYARADHEVALRDAIATALPNVDVICSHEVLPEIREYERTATTVAEAYARPAVKKYLDELGSRLKQRDMPMPRVLTSAGGTMAATDAATHAASLALSGPAGGVAGAAAFIRALGLSHALTIDIGGTSADVGLVIDGDPLVERGGAVAGVPIALPRVMVEAVAAGGGSIGWLDEGGALRAGPESAGAVPGPAAYGRGGDRPTVTDAHVVLRHVAEGSWSGGVSISRDLAVAAMTPLSAALGVSVERAAAGLIATADATMARALRRISVERGIDPRGVALLAFGGGGPLHCCGLAERLGMRRIVVPPHAGVLSAVGLALAPERRERLASMVSQLDALDADALRALLQLEAERLQLPGEKRAQTRARWWLRARYQGQGHELDIPVQPDDDGATISARFVDTHRARTGFVLERGVESISLRTALLGEPWPTTFARRAAESNDVLPTDLDDGRQMERTLEGPHTVRLPDATLRIPISWTARALPQGGWMLEKQEP